MLEWDTFICDVRECLRHLHDPAYLEKHPLARVLVRGGEPHPGEALRRSLLDAIDRLKPSDPALQVGSSAQWRRYYCVSLRYKDTLPILQVAGKLGISPRQVSRDQQKGLESVAHLLWTRAALPLEASAARTANGPTRGGISASRLPEPMLESELTLLAETQVKEPTRLRETVEGVLSTVASLARERRVSLEALVPDTTAPVFVNRIVFRQALFNLICCAIGLQGNSLMRITAADTPRGVELRLGLHRRRGRPSVLKACDHDQPSADVLLEAGRRLLETQGGIVEFQRRSEAQVAINVVLPPIKMPTVLVIDDNTDYVALFRRFLKQANYRLVHAGTAETALRLASELTPDVITLDLMMPSQDGWEILEQLRRNEVTRQIPVVVCSVLPENALARSLGVTAFLAKPVTQESLLSVLNRCLRRPGPEGHPG